MSINLNLGLTRHVQLLATVLANTALKNCLHLTPTPSSPWVGTFLEVKMKGKFRTKLIFRLLLWLNLLPRMKSVFREFYTIS